MIQTEVSPALDALIATHRAAVAATSPDDAELAMLAMLVNETDPRMVTALLVAAVARLAQ